MLNLNEFLPKDERVQFNGEDFVLTAEIPVDLMLEMQEVVGSVDEKNFHRKDMENTRAIIGRVLKLRNPAAKVDKMVSGLSFLQFLRLTRFLFEFLRVSMTEKDEGAEKKSDD
jgi:hypothetical protein